MSKKPKSPVEVIEWLRSEWVLRDLNVHDFNKAIKDVLDIETTTPTEEGETA